MTAPGWFQIVERNLASGRPLLDGVALEHGGLLDHFLPGFCATTAIAGAATTAVDGGLCATGLADLVSLGTSRAYLSLIATPDGWTGVFSNDVSLTPLPLPFVKNALVDRLAIEVRFGGSDNAITYVRPVLAGRVSIGGHVSAIEFTPAGADGDWRIALDERFDLSSAGAVLEAMAGGGALDAAPLKSFLGAVSVSNVALGLRSQDRSPDEVRFDVLVDSVSLPIPGVTLQDFCFAFLAANLASPEERAVSASVSGRIGVGSAAVDIYGQVPDLAFRGALTGGLEMAFGELYEQLVRGKPPLALPAFSVSDLAIDLRLHEPSVRVHTRVDGQWPIPGTGATLDEIVFDLELSAADPHVTVSATTILAGSDIRVDGTFGPGLELEGTFPATSLSALLSRFNVEKPAEIPDIQFGPSTVAVSSLSQTIHLSGSAAVAHDFFSSGQAPPPQTAVAFSIDLSANTSPAIQLTVSTAAHVTIENSVTIEGFTLEFSLGADGTWRASGKVPATFMNTRLDLAAGYESSKTDSRFTLAIQAANASIEIGAAATIGITSFTLAMTRSAGDATAKVGVLAQASLQLRDLLTLDGTLTASGVGLAFTPTRQGDATLTLRLPAVSPAHTPPRVVASFEKVDIARAAGPDGQAVGHWGCTVSASIQLLDVPAPADALFSTKPTTGTFTVDSTGISVTIEPPSGASFAVTFAKGTSWEVDLPAIRVDTLSLGRHATSPGDGAEWRLDVTLGVSGLDRLNVLCGGAEVFRNSVDLEVTLGTSLAVTPKTSPFNAIELRTKADGTVWTAFSDFFGSGLFSFRVPELSFDFTGGRWHAAGGVESQGRLQIPLQPVKWLAEKCGIGSAALQPMPDAIPLVDLDLKSPKFYDQIAGVLGQSDPEHVKAFKAIADELAKGVDALPDQLKEYLVLHIPTNFTFDLTIEPTGGASFGVRVEDGKPLRALAPFIAGVPPLPGLLGVTVYAISFGLTAGGQIGVLKYDGCVDQFDVLDLGYALITGKGSDIGNRIVMRNLEALVPIAAPVPIPLFYDEIGWEYKNLLGLALQLHASFPNPQPALSDWVKLLGDLFHFFAEKDFLLHAPGHLPQAMQLDFQIRPTFLALPAYLGGKVLGSRDALPPLPVAQTLARALDSVKTGNVGDLIQAVPLKYDSNGTTHWIRVGHEDVHFGPLHLQAAWCITTEDEFRNDVLRDDTARKAIAAANPQDMVECTPARLGGKSYDKGFLVLLMGEVGAGTPLTDIVSFRAQFGMALLNPRDCQTAIRIVGRFGPEGALSLAIEGCIDVHPDAAHPDSVAVVVEGNVTLTVLGHRFSAASSVTVVPGELLRGHVSFALNRQLAVDGTLTVDAHGIAIDGSIDWSGLAGQRFQVASRAVISKGGITFQPIAVIVGAFSAKATLRLPGAAQGEVFTMGVRIDIPESFFASLKASFVSVADEVVTKEVSDGYEKVRQAIASQQSFEPSLRGLQKLVPDICTAIAAAIRKAVSKQAVYAAMDAWAAQGSLVERVPKEAAVAAAKLTGPEAVAQRAAQDWIDKLTAIAKVAAASIENSAQYRRNLQAALRRLKTPNTIEVRIGAIGMFPGLVVYQRPVLDASQLKMLDQSIAMIDLLQQACDAQVSAGLVLATMPKPQQLLAKVRQDIKEGIEAGVPTVTALSFDTSAGLSTLASVDLTATVSYYGTAMTYRVRANLSTSGDLPSAIARAFAGVG